MDVTTISGINSFAIYIDNHTKYFFFGDFHGNNLNNCDKEFHCDYFNYTFTKTLTYNTSCTTIGPLLFNWLAYNKKNNISTSFLLEKSYKEDDLHPVFNQLVKNRKLKNYNNLSTIFPDKMSWLELVVYLSPTFAIKPDNIDIRFLRNERVSPFHLQFLYKLDNRNEIINFIKMMILNYKYILLSLLTNYNLDPLFNFILSKLTGEFKIVFEHRILLINQLVNNQHIVGKTLSDLAMINAKRASDIIEFITLLADEHMQNITLNTDMNLESFLDYYVTVFTVLGAYTMDAYVLAKMFLNPKEVIVYTGAAHIEVYHLFFQNYLNLAPIYESTVDENKCITFEDLPLYLNINEMRN